MAAVDYTGAKVVGVMPIDPETGKGYRIEIQVVEGGSVDVAPLAKQATLQQLLTSVEGLPRRDVQDVRLTNEELPLPGGSATALLQQALNSTLEQIQAILSSGLDVTLQNESISATIASLPLPEGAATSANQQAIIQALAGTFNVSIVGTPTVALSNNGVRVLEPVAISNTSFVVTDGGGSITVDVPGGVEIVNQLLQVAGTVSVSGITAPVAVTDNGTSLTVDGVVNVGQSALPDGAATEATLATFLGRLPSSLGSKTSSGSLSVTLSSDQAPLPVQSNIVSGTEALISVPAATSSTQLRQAAASRRGLRIYNASTANLYVNSAGGAATVAGSSTKILPGQTWEVQAPVPTNAIFGIWDAANGSAQISEVA